MVNTVTFPITLLVEGQDGAMTLVNEGFFTIDAFLAASVINRTLTTPPGSPTEGQRHLVPSGASSPWNTQAGKIAIWHNGAWVYYTPKEGMQLWVEAEDRWVIYDGTNWIGESFTRTISILNPTNAENITALYAQKALTVRRVTAILRGSGSPSVQYRVRTSSSRNAGSPTDILTSSPVTVSAVATPTPITSFANSAIAAGNFVWITTEGSVGATTNEFSVTIEFGDY